MSNIRNIFEDEMNIRILQQRLQEKELEIENIIEKSTNALKTATETIRLLKIENELLKKQLSECNK